MQNIIHLTIDGSPVTARPGQTILDVARQQNIMIPTLCHDDRLKPFGSCQLCRVEVEGARGTMLACATQVVEGMVIRSETEAVKASQKTCLELLVSQHQGDCFPPCSMTCPAEVDVQGYIAYIANGQYQEAIKLIKEKNPLPLVCGRVCTRPCEDECRRNLVDERVGIDYLKRFVADYDLSSGRPYLPPKKPATGKKVAVIGAGPAGLSCAYYLVKEGHSVTIFERWPHGGGMLRYGIPEYRLPKGIVDKEIDLIKALGVEIRYNTTFGREVTYRTLRQEGYGALFLAVGSQIGMSMGCDGESCTSGVFTGVDFLGKVGANVPFDFSGKKVIVIGGGNTAIDAARTSLRLGAGEVRIAYRRTRGEMPAHQMEIEEAEHEGCHLDLLTAPLSMTHEENGRIKVVFYRMELGDMDASGRRKPVLVPNSEFEVYCDYVIGAIGQTQDLSFVDSAFDLALDRNRIQVDPDLMTTNLDGVFAGGDAVTGPRTVISAIAAGRRAALSIDKYVRGEKLEKPPKSYNHTKGKLEELDKSDFATIPKVSKERMPMLNNNARRRNFQEVELGFSEEQARREAQRCLSCGCKDVHECKLKEYASQYNVTQNRLAGAISKHPIDESHPYIVRDQNKCILCGRCVRICHELQGAGALGFLSRGYETVIATSFGQPFGEETRCYSCGQCVSTCPVGALVEKVRLPQPGPFSEEVHATICSHCGTGCTIHLRSTGGRFLRVTAPVGQGVNNGNLCVRGKFGNDFIDAPDRLTVPLVRKHGKLEESTWEEAYRQIGERLAKYQDSVGVYASQRLTNEELYMAKQLAEKAFQMPPASFGLGTASRSAACVLNNDLARATYDDLKAADLIICVDFDPTAANSVVGLMMKEVSEQGVALVLVGERAGGMQRYAKKVVSVVREDMAAFMARWAKALNGYVAEDWACSTTTEPLEDMAPLADMLRRSAKPVFVIDGELGANEAEAVGHLAFAAGKTDRWLLVLHANCNTQGALDLGYVDAGCQSQDAMVILGQDPVGSGVEWAAVKLKQAQFKVVADIYLTETAKMADVVLPLVTFAETAGTFTNNEGRVQHLTAAMAPKTGKSNWAVIADICRAVGVSRNSATPAYRAST